MFSALAPFKVRIYTRQGTWYAQEAANTEEEARDCAIRWTTAEGQRAWIAYVSHAQRGAVAKYRGGKEMKVKP